MHICAPNSCRLYKSTIWHFQEMHVCNVEINTLWVGNYLSVSLGDQCMQNTGCRAHSLCFMSKLLYFFWYGQLFLFCILFGMHPEQNTKTRSNNGLGSCLHCFLLCLLRNQRIKIELCRFAVNLQVTYRKTNSNLLKIFSDRHL